MLHYSPYSRDEIVLDKDYQFVEVTTNKIITVPKGFVSDGASIPRLLWVVLGSPFSPKLIRAAIQHDYLIAIGFSGDARDLQFYTTLRKYGVKTWKAYVMYLGVRYWRKLKNLFTNKGD